LIHPLDTIYVGCELVDRTSNFGGYELLNFSCMYYIIVVILYMIAEKKMFKPKVL